MANMKSPSIKILLKEIEHEDGAVVAICPICKKPYIDRSRDGLLFCLTPVCLHKVFTSKKYSYLKDKLRKVSHDIEARNRLQELNRLLLPETHIKALAEFIKKLKEVSGD